MMKVFSSNLKRLRVSKNMTQEQAAEALGVSAQSISRWECANTMPDITLLPEIARLYCVTIDDLYREQSIAYDNYAHRLGAIYEATRRPEDFLRADTEYHKLIKNGTASAEDLRLYGMLHQYMMEQCKDKALSLYEQVLKQGIPPDEEIYWRTVYWRTRRQKIKLSAQCGQVEQEISTAFAMIEKEPHQVEHWICLLASCQYSEQWGRAQQYMNEALKCFPDNSDLLFYCGEVYRSMKQYDNAFLYWTKVLEFDPDYSDAYYAMGFCYEEINNYQKAYETWTELAAYLEKRGYDMEYCYPQTLAKRCFEKL